MIKDDYRCPYINSAGHWNNRLDASMLDPARQVSRAD